jgi:hypothetical protein
MFCGPWYFIRNQVMGVGFYMLKYRMVDRFLLAHNTFVGWNTLNINDQNILYALSRNNLWIQAGGSGYIWEAMPCTDASSCTRPERWAPDYRTSVDYDGFDVGASNPVFKWFDPAQRFATLAAFTSALGIEPHAVAVTKADLFDSLMPLDADSLYSRHYLTLRAGCGAVDKGDILPGINQDFSGLAPDLGAYETNKPLPWYGPRPENGNPVLLNVGSLRPVVPTVSLVPRRGTRWLDIRVHADDKKCAIVRIYNVSGKLLGKQTATPARGDLRTVSWLAPSAGVFFVNVAIGEDNCVRRFIVR